MDHNEILGVCLADPVDAFFWQNGSTVPYVGLRGKGVGILDSKLHGDKQQM